MKRVHLKHVKTPVRMLGYGAHLPIFVFNLIQQQEVQTYYSQQNRMHCFGSIVDEHSTLQTNNSHKIRKNARINALGRSFYTLFFALLLKQFKVMPQPSFF